MTTKIYCGNEKGDTGYRVEVSENRVYVQNLDIPACCYVWQEYKNPATARATARRLAKDQEAARRLYTRIKQEVQQS